MSIISRTPFRISFFGGGTDYPKWFEEEPGAVLATTIDKYCYLSIRNLPPFFKYNTRVVWSHIELVKKNHSIKHPSVRECLRYMKMEEGLEIVHNADLPARTGMGSSSAFTVGLLNSLFAMKGKMISKMELARAAMEVEQDYIRENVGCQDQLSASFGGFNLVEFGKNRDFRIYPVTVTKKRQDELKQSLLLCFTGFSRIASDIAQDLVDNTADIKPELRALREMVDEGMKILDSSCDISEFGRLLDKSWGIKRGLTKKITNAELDNIYDTAKKNGATGGKLLGAGGGGFMLFFASPERHEKIKKALKKFLFVPFDFENLGSQIIFYQP